MERSGGRQHTSSGFVSAEKKTVPVAHLVGILYGAMRQPHIIDRQKKGIGFTFVATPRQPKTQHMNGAGIILCGIGIEGGFKSAHGTSFIGTERNRRRYTDLV